MIGHKQARHGASALPRPYAKPEIRKSSKEASLRRVGRAPRAAKPSIDQLCIDTIRTLSMDAVQKAASGHPGAPMALAPVIYTLWQEFLRYDPDDPLWPNRDRFVLSNGHASMLLYAMLHLAGVRAVDAHGRTLAEPAVSLDDIKNFRQIGGKCPGHPEYGVTTGVEATTGPLGQGCGMSVGMAIGGAWLAQHFNRPGHTLFDYNIYALCSDGDMMEGVSSEAASLAGHLMLGNLCWIYDSNQVTIEGRAELALSEDVAARFRAYGWNVQRVADANDTERLAAAFESFRGGLALAPTLIIVESHIGYGAPHKHDTSAAHGEPLGVEEIRLAKRAYHWPEDSSFLVPDGVRERVSAGVGQRGARSRAGWLARMDAYRAKYPDLAGQLEQMGRRGLPEGWDAGLPSFDADAKGLATRESSGKALNAIASRCPWLVGGAADLSPSTRTRLTFEGAGDFEAGRNDGRNLHFGVREHAMAAIVNGLALSGLRSFGSTFLIFSDYMKPAIRLGAIMRLPVVHVFTHDSIGLGEDGTTHQPVEQLVGLRATPGLITLRPADANEAVEAWRVIIGAWRAGLPGAHPAEDAHIRPDALRLRQRRRQRRVCLGRCGRRQEGVADPDRLRQRGRAVPCCAGQTRTGRRRDAGRQHALLGIVRTPGSSLSRKRSAAGNCGARLGRGRLGHRLGSLCRRPRRENRHARLWRIGACRRSGEEIRLHGRRHMRRGAAAPVALSGVTPTPRVRRIGGAAFLPRTLPGPSAKLVFKRRALAADIACLIEQPRPISHRPLDSLRGQKAEVPESATMR